MFSWSDKFFILGIILLASLTGPHDLVGGFQEILASEQLLGHRVGLISPK